METNSSTSLSKTAPPPATQDLPGAEPELRLTALWLFLIGVLLIETCLRLLPEGYMTRTIQHRAEEVRYLPPADIQLMGDSATSAVRTSLLERTIGASHQVSNYALPGTSPLFNYFVLRRQIATGKIPKLIVLAPNPFTWGDPMLDRFLARFATPGESARFLLDGGKPSDWFYGTLCRFSYTLRYREEFYKAITSADTTFFRQLENPISSVQNTRAKIAETEAPPVEPATSVIDTNNLPPLFLAPITIHPYNELYLAKLCKLAEANGIRILWLSLPVPQLLQEKFPNPQRALAYSRFVERMTAKHKNLFAPSTAVPTLPDTHFMDAWHMNAYGAWVFSRQVGEQIAKWEKEHSQ